MNMEDLLLNLFKEDFSLNGDYSYISQISIITIKSLLPMKNEEAVRIDYKRFMEEFNLWKSYRNGDNISLLNTGDKIDPNIYWNEKDDSILSRIIPLVLANQNYNIIEEEIIKNILFTTGNIESLFEGICIAYLLNEIISNPREDIIEKLKNRIINLAQVDFIKEYKDYYKVGIDKYPNNYKISFEREKIHLLNLLNGIDNNKYLELRSLLDVVNESKPNRLVEKNNLKLPSFYNNMGDYLISLRKSRIAPEKLVIDEYILPDIFKFNLGDIFFHSLLRDCKIIRKEAKGDFVISIVQTRTGIYKFKKMALL